MKYALISDIHGNLPALEAVMADANQKSVDHFVFLGDYIEDLPWPNEVTELIRSTENATVIRGNKEDYLENLRHEDRAGWISEQFAPIYWNCRKLTPRNYDYLTNLPDKAVISAPNGEKIYLSHSSTIFFRNPRVEPMHSSHYLRKMLESPLSQAEYFEYARHTVLNRPDVMEEIAQCPKGIHAFGHNHLQWHMENAGVFHVNPGSCGVPLGFSSDASYTIIELIANAWNVLECCVTYDVEATINELKNSSLFEQAEIWSRVMIHQLRDGRDYISFFLRHAMTVAKKYDEDAVYPVSNEVWHEAAKSFEMIDVYKI